MKKKVKKVRLLVMLATLLLPAAVLSMVDCARAGGDTAAYTRLHVNPTDYTSTALGEAFTVKVMIENATNLRGFEFKLSYDTTILDALEVTEGDFLKNFGTTCAVKLEINETAGSVWVAVALLGMIPAKGDGTIATLRFSSIDEGECHFDLYDTLLVDMEALGVNHLVNDANSVDEFVDPPPPEAPTPTEIYQAIAEGVEWLVARQNVDGSWGSLSPLAQTGFAVLKLETHAISAGIDPLDPSYLYYYEVRQGLDFIFLNTGIESIEVQPAGDPDTDGDGIGVFWGPEITYCTGIAMMAIAASTHPDMIVDVEGSVSGWTYKEVLQDAVDYLAFGQTDLGLGRGGWGYAANEGWSDNSNSGYAVLGLAYAELTEIQEQTGFGCVIPSFVRTELDLWIDYIQVDITGGQNDGGSGYSAPDDWVNILKTGNLLFEMAFVGDESNSSRVVDAVRYIERHWNEENSDPGWRGEITAHKQAMYTTMRGLEAFGIETISVDSMEINWFDEMATVLLEQQNIDGSWSIDPWGDELLGTEWALLTLQKVSPDIQPPPLIPCDFNGDGVVDQTDLQLLIDSFGDTGPPGWIPQDMNNDGKIDMRDIGMFLMCALRWEKVPPITQIELDGLICCGWYVSDVTVTLTATDWISGIYKTEYSFNEVDWIEYTDPFQVTDEGVTTLYYRSIDNSWSHNIEPTNSQDIKIDKTAPTIDIVSPAPENYTQAELLTLDFSSTDTVSGVASTTGVLYRDPATLHLNPQISTANVGEAFSVDVCVADVIDLYVWEIKLRWDPTILDLLGIAEGDFLSSVGPTIWPTPEINKEEGWARFACTLFISPSGASGSGTLANITFNCVAYGETDLDIADPFDTYLLDSTLGEIPFEIVDGYFTSLLPEEHDIAVTSVTVSTTKVASGDPVTVAVNVENQGTRTETFDVSVLYDSNIIATQTVISLTMGSVETLIFTWNTAGVDLGSYLIKAEATVVPGEVETIDNIFVNGVVMVGIPVYSGQTLDLSTFQLGKYTLTVTAIDNACNEAIKSVTFTVATTLSGVVTDEYTNEPITGVTIGIFETGESTVTDEYGKYSFLICSTGIYTVEMTVPYGYLTHDDVTKFTEVTEATTVDFTLYQAAWSDATVPRTIGYWKNWKNHYSAAIMETLIANVKSSSGLFNDLTVDNIEYYLRMGRRSMEQKGEAQLLASWLNVVSAQLGVDVAVDLTSIFGWESVIVDDDGTLTVHELLEQIDDLYLTNADLTKEQWETVKDILDALNNGQLFIEE